MVLARQIQGRRVGLRSSSVIAVHIIYHPSDNPLLSPVSALLNVMSMYHDTLLSKVVQNDPKYRPLIPSSLHTRFTRAWSDRDFGYKWAARALELIRFTELFVEMGLRRKVSSNKRWRAVILLEAIKYVSSFRYVPVSSHSIPSRAVLRLLLLRTTRRPLLSPPIPEREFDPSTLTLPSNTSSPTLAPSSSSSSPPATPEHLKNNYIPLPPHPLLTSPPPTRSDTSVEDYLLPKALIASSVKPSLSLVRTLSSPQDWLAESIYILRPLVYGNDPTFPNFVDTLKTVCSFFACF